MTSPDVSNVTVDTIEQDLRRNVINKEYIILFSNDPDRVSTDDVTALRFVEYFLVETYIYWLLAVSSCSAFSRATPLQLQCVREQNHVM